MSSPVRSDKIQIRQAKPEDAEVAGPILYEAFASINRSHNFPVEIPAPEAAIGALTMLFSHPGFYSIVAESEGRIVGSNCLDERSIISGLGPVSVEPGVQNSGVGRALMIAMLDRVRQQGAPGVRLLQSAFHNRSLALYAKLGFDAREPMSVMAGQPAGTRIEGCVVRPATTSDIDDCNRLCSHVHGFPRTAELQEGIAQTTALVVERPGRITGYASGFGYFGYAVAESNSELQALVASAKNIGGPGIIVPTRNAELFRWCLNNGMRVLQPMTLMTSGLYNEPMGSYIPSVLY